MGADGPRPVLRLVRTQPPAPQPATPQGSGELPASRGFDLSPQMGCTSARGERLIGSRQVACAEKIAVARSPPRRKGTGHRQQGKHEPGCSTPGLRLYRSRAQNRSFGQGRDFGPAPSAAYLLY